MLLFLVVSVCHASNPARCAFQGFIVWTIIASRFIDRLWWGFQRFFQTGSSFQTHFIVLISVARWRHNIREIAVKNCEKSNRRKRLCAPLRV